MDGDIRPLEPADPREVGGHRLLGRLGSGGMGTVYLGTDPVSGGRVAVKTIHPHLAGDPSYRRRFRDEAALAGRVASFCTARVLAHGEEDGRPYLVTDYVGGVSLHHRLGGDGPLPPADLHGVAVGVASALAAIHAAGLVHRDLKPGNVMLTLSGCRVIDFGIARSVARGPTSHGSNSHASNSHGTNSRGPGARGQRPHAERSHGQDAPGRTAANGRVFGTPGWMAPEVLRGGPATPAADIFAWGCLIAHAGTGRLPFGDDLVATRGALGEPDLAGLPDALLPCVRAALARDPRDRPSAPDLLLALVEQGGDGGRTAGTENRAGLWREGGAPRRPEQPNEPGSATKAFTPVGLSLAEFLSSSRTRLLAGAGTILVGAVVLGRIGARHGVRGARR
ncbi:serine/threonine-protein kinase [Actinomadura litoris]|uniref:serine/threonine-protein kinase n=1 Tax=Actinomadura litoris TaxID=2678616 RepID=UPI001FA6BF0B|nr:serine/threonine-protein kinase [Actinomadura litoris]